MGDNRSWFRRKFDQFLDPASEGSKSSLYHLFVAAAGFVVAIWLAAILLPKAGFDGGTFGDFIGGTLNPVLTFLTFMALLITIFLQQTELASTREELSRSADALNAQLESLDRQAFETTLFHLLNTLNTFVGSFEVTVNHGQTRRGRDVLRYHFGSDFDRTFANADGDDTGRVHKGIAELDRNFGGNIDQYINMLFGIFEFIDNSSGDKYRYAALVRSQLSQSELLILTYYAMVGRLGQWWDIINRYSLLFKLPAEQLLSDEHRSYFVQQAFHVDYLTVGLQKERDAAAERRREKMAH